VSRIGSWALRTVPRCGHPDGPTRRTWPCPGHTRPPVTGRAQRAEQLAAAPELRSEPKVPSLCAYVKTLSVRSERTQTRMAGSGYGAGWDRLYGRPRPTGTWRLPRSGDRAADHSRRNVVSTSPADGYWSLRPATRPRTPGSCSAFCHRVSISSGRSPASPPSRTSRKRRSTSTAFWSLDSHSALERTLRVLTSAQIWIQSRIRIQMSLVAETTAVWPLLADWKPPPDRRCAPVRAGQVIRTRPMVRP
jgi:hypothetical protein